MSNQIKGLWADHGKCNKCKHHLYVGVDEFGDLYECRNEDSESYLYYTGLEDGCEEWEGSAAFTE